MENLQDGRILLSGWAGINIFHPDSVDSHRPPPPVVITRMAINDETFVPSQVTNESSSCNCPYTQNVLEFEFAAIDLVAPECLFYRYRLEGLEKDWVTPKDRRYVRYPGLSPGDYVFSVTAVSLMGRVARTGDHSRIQHRPPRGGGRRGRTPVMASCFWHCSIRDIASVSAGSSEATGGDGTLSGGASRRSGSAEIPILLKHLS